MVAHFPPLHIYVPKQTICLLSVLHKHGCQVEVSAVDPLASMAAVKNQALTGIAGEVQVKLKNVIENL